MDQATEEHAGEKQRLARIATAFENGIVLVDGSGSIVWMDRIARRRVNGELRNLVLPLAKSEDEALDCFIAPVDLTVNGKHLSLGVVQQTGEQRQGSDLIAAIETAFADSTSWFARTFIDKLKTVGQPKPASAPCTNTAGNGARRVEMLSAREREVLGLICEGQSDAQMATMLGLSENTVRNHIASLYRKIGVNRRTAAVIWARERGITCRDDLTSGRPLRAGNGRGNGHDLLVG